MDHNLRARQMPPSKYPDDMEDFEVREQQEATDTQAPLSKTSKWCGTKIDWCHREGCAQWDEINSQCCHVTTALALDVLMKDGIPAITDAIRRHR